MKVKIHREGLNILLALLVVLLAINVPLYLCLENRVVPIVTISISTIFYLLVVNFFRSPRRHRSMVRWWHLRRCTKTNICIAM